MRSARRPLLREVKEMTQPGWYTDPADATTSRFWTGSAWSASRQWNGNQWIEVPVAPMVANPYPAAYPTAYSAAYPYPAAAPGVAGPMPIQRPDRRATN